MTRRGGRWGQPGALALARSARCAQPLAASFQPPELRCPLQCHTYLPDLQTTCGGACERLGVPAGDVFALGRPPLDRIALKLQSCVLGRAARGRNALDCRCGSSIKLAGSPCHKDLLSQGLVVTGLVPSVEAVTGVRFGVSWPPGRERRLSRASAAWEAAPDHAAPVPSDWKK